LRSKSYSALRYFYIRVNKKPHTIYKGPQNCDRLQPEDWQIFYCWKQALKGVLHQPTHPFTLHLLKIKLNIFNYFNLIRVQHYLKSNPELVLLFVMFSSTGFKQKEKFPCQIPLSQENYWLLVKAFLLTKIIKVLDK
jgi:hypothetical protein